VTLVPADWAHGKGPNLLGKKARQPAETCSRRGAVSWAGKSPGWRFAMTCRCVAVADYW